VVAELCPGERVAVEVVEGDDRVPVDELARERRADEARAARDQHAALDRAGHRPGS
jgi:hypothetical protein